MGLLSDLEKVNVIGEMQKIKTFVEAEIPKIHATLAELKAMIAAASPHVVQPDSTTPNKAA